MDDTNTAICLQILRLWRRIKTVIADYATEHDLTLQQIFVLYHLYDEDHILMGALASRMHCDASNVTGIIDRLENGGLLERRPLPEDRRAKELAITAKGRAMIEDLIPRLPENSGLEQLSPTERTRLHELLIKT